MKYVLISEKQWNVERENTAAAVHALMDDQNNLALERLLAVTNIKIAARPAIDAAEVEATALLIANGIKDRMTYLEIARAVIERFGGRISKEIVG